MNQLGLWPAEMHKDKDFCFLKHFDEILIGMKLILSYFLLITSWGCTLVTIKKIIFFEAHILLLTILGDHVVRCHHVTFAP